MKFLEKIRRLPLKTRKIILWVSLIILGSIMLGWWLNRFSQKMEGLEPGKFIEEMDLPKITVPEIPSLSDEEVQQIKDTLNNIETNAEQESQIQEN